MGSGPEEGEELAVCIWLYQAPLWTTLAFHVKSELEQARPEGAGKVVMNDSTCTRCLWKSSA
jgi:hypothetical protein